MPACLLNHSKHTELHIGGKWCYQLMSAEYHMPLIQHCPSATLLSRLLFANAGRQFGLLCKVYFGTVWKGEPDAAFAPSDMEYKAFLTLLGWGIKTYSGKYKQPQGGSKSEKEKAFTYKHKYQLGQRD